MSRDELVALGNTEARATRRDKSSSLPKINKKQSIQRMYWSFTYHNYNIDTKDTIEMKIFLEVLRHECKWFIIQEETGEETNKDHLQGCLYLNKSKRLSAIKKLGNNNIHWEETNKISASAYYCSRKDKRKGEIFTHNFELPYEETIEIQEPYGWQKDIIDIIEQKPDERTIHWFWEPEGGVGKSTLTKYLVVKKNALMVSGNSKDMFHAITKNPSRRKIIIFDIPRSNLEHINYPGIEHIKNGLIFSGKYDSCQTVFNKPHVIIFANEPPNLNKTLSKDKFNIINIRNPIKYEASKTQDTMIHEIAIDN